MGQHKGKCRNMPKSSGNGQVRWTKATAIAMSFENKGQNSNTPPTTSRKLKKEEREGQKEI